MGCCLVCMHITLTFFQVSAQMDFNQMITREILTAIWQKETFAEIIGW